MVRTPSQRNRSPGVVTCGPDPPPIRPFYVPRDIELVVVETNPEAVHQEPGDEDSLWTLDVGPAFVTCLSNEDNISALEKACLSPGCASLTTVLPGFALGAHPPGG
jgi:hypothetical protein